jgi:hypothetical protein
MVLLAALVLKRRLGSTALISLVSPSVADYWRVLLEALDMPGTVTILEAVGGEEGLLDGSLFLRLGEA